MAPIRETLPFTVISERSGDDAYLYVSGEIDLATAPLLDDRLLEADRDAASSIVVNLARVTFMDGRGLRSFLRAAERAHRNDKTFVMLEVPSMVKRVIELTKTTHLLDATLPIVLMERQQNG